MSEPSESILAAWEQKTFAFLESQGFAPWDAVLLLAVSGGADSVALVDFWIRRGATRFGCRVRVIHVNHGLRPAAEGDQAFVEELCRRLEIPCVSRKLDPGSRRPRESVEMWARRERYRCFREAAAQAGADWVLTAHHRDDLVETVFQRLGRGTGPRGLAGIPFIREPDVWQGQPGIVRPFLNRSRGEILGYLRLAGLPWREDESNADTGIDRNWYRHRFLPRLRREIPDLDERVAALAMRMQEMRPACDALEQSAELLQRDVQGRPYLSAALVREKIAEGDCDSLVFWCRRLIDAATGSPRSVTKEILREFLRQWRSHPESLCVRVSGGVALKREINGIYCMETGFPAVGKKVAGAKKPCPVEVQKVILGDAYVEPGGMAWRWGEVNFRLSIRRFPKPRDLLYPGPREKRAIFDADLFSCTLDIRTRKNGDRFSPLGVRSQSRKLKTFFNEEKIPIRIRDLIPVIACDETLAWVPGYGISEFFKVSGKTTRILELVLACENP